MIRRQLPGYSPVGLRGLVRGLVAGGPAEQAVTDLERVLAERLRADDVVATGSGTQALQLALRLAMAELGDGAEPMVALPAFNCYDLVSAAVGAGAPVVFYDVDPEHLVPERDTLVEALELGANIVVAANLFGFPLDWDVLREVAGGRAVLVEDAAQGVGSAWGGLPGGAAGDISVLSFGRGTGWTGGGGGAVLVRGDGRGSIETDWVNSEAGPLRPTVALLAQWALGRPSLYRLPTSIPGLALGETVYHPPGAIQGMSGTAASILMAHDAEATAAVGTRRSHAAEWTDALAECLADGQWRAPAPLDACSYHRFPLLAPSGAAAGRLAALGRDRGAVRSYPTALHRLAEARPIASGPVGALPGAEALAERVVTLPTHRFVTADDIDSVARTLSSLR